MLVYLQLFVGLLCLWSLCRHVLSLCGQFVSLWSSSIVLSSFFSSLCGGLAVFVLCLFVGFVSTSVCFTCIYGQFFVSVVVWSTTWSFPHCLSFSGEGFVLLDLISSFIRFSVVLVFSNIETQA